MNPRVRKEGESNYQFILKLLLVSVIAVEPARPREQRRVIAESGEVHEEYLKELRMVSTI